MPKKFLEIINLTKVFGTVVANNKINLHVNESEILAVLGENGAGKSTLMNMIAGVYLQNSGSIKIEGVETTIDSPKTAKRLGIGMLHQRFKLIHSMTALENIILGHVSTINPKKKEKKLELQILMNEYNINIDLDKFVYDMSMGEKQLLEILRLLYRGAKLLILDEPTTVLTPQEVEILFNIVFMLKAKGHSIIFISHKLSEVMEVSDRVVILRKGETVASMNTSEVDIPLLTEYMVGSSIDLDIKREPVVSTRSVLNLSNISLKNEYGFVTLNDVSFTVNKGEILGIAGINGHGQKEICDVIMGIQKAISGSIILNDQDITNLSTKEILLLKDRISYVPEDRLGMGLVPSMNLQENILLREYIKQGFVLDQSSSIKIGEGIIETLDVQTTGLDQKLSLMSGGNIQKLLIGRELQYNPDLLILAYPVRGIDIQTTYKIYNIVNAQKSHGVGVLYVAEDLDSLIQLCDRILVLHHGKVAKIVDARMTTKEEIGLLMLGEKEVSA